MIEMYTEPDIDADEPAEDTSAARERVNHIAFFASLVAIALIVLVTAVVNHDGASGEQPCDQVDVNVQLRWEGCGGFDDCDADGNYANGFDECCFASDDWRAPGCCQPPRERDPLRGLFDAEAGFTDGGFTDDVEPWCVRSG